MGSGAFGVVTRGSVEIDTVKNTVAVKTMKPGEDIVDFKASLLELKIMAYIGRHPNIVNLLAACTDYINARKSFLANISFTGKWL